MDKDLELKNLLCLLDDPNENVWHPIRDTILRKGKSILKALQEEWQMAEDPLLAARINDLITIIQFGQLQDDWLDWWISNKGNLKEGWVLLSRVIDPDFNLERFEKLLKPIYNEIWIELSDKLTALEKVRVINYLLFEKHSLVVIKSINIKAKHMFVSNLLSSGSGHPMAIASLFCLLCRELSIPVYKVGNMENSGLAYLENYNIAIHTGLESGNSKALFYILPDKQGEIISQRQYADHFHQEFPSYILDLNLIPDKEFIRLILSELQFYYKEENNKLLLGKVNQLLSLSKA